MDERKTRGTHGIALDGEDWWDVLQSHLKTHYFKLAYNLWLYAIRTLYVILYLFLIPDLYVIYFNYLFILFFLLLLFF